MLLIGKKKSKIKSKIPKDIICPECETPNATEVSVIGVYKHLFQIPFLSGGKRGTSICTNCKITYELQHMPGPIKLAYYELKETIRTPIWYYAGLIAVKTLVLIKIFSRYF
jgi:hypothetical protein